MAKKKGTRTNPHSWTDFCRDAMLRKEPCFVRKSKGKGSVLLEFKPSGVKTTLGVQLKLLTGPKLQPLRTLKSWTEVLDNRETLGYLRVAEPEEKAKSKKLPFQNKETTSKSEDPLEIIRRQGLLGELYGLKDVVGDHLSEALEHLLLHLEGNKESDWEGQVTFRKIAFYTLVRITAGEEERSAMPHLFRLCQELKVELEQGDQSGDFVRPIEH